MTSADALRKAWSERLRLLPVDPVMAITDKGPVLSAGTVLAKRRTDQNAPQQIASLRKSAVALPVPGPGSASL